MFKIIKDFLVAMEKAALAAHFARMGDAKAAQAIFKD